MGAEATENNKLSRMDLFSMAIGQIIGVGIMTMTGIAIGFTGRSVPFAYILACVLSVIAVIPQIFIGGTANFLGGQYSQIAVLGNKKLAGLYTYVNLCMLFAISMYTLSFADYFISLVPGVNGRLVGCIALSVIFLMHLTGVKQAARLQNVLSIILAIAIAAYIAFGVGSISPDYFVKEQFMTGGVGGFALASVYLTFACGGAAYVVNYSSQAKNPTKDIPFVIVTSTLGIGIIYAVMSAIAAGVLPVEQVANQPLSVAGAEFMPGPVFTFFVVGGAMFALLTTLNFSIGMMVYPVLRACKDGWLPKGLTVTNKKFGTPHLILLVFYLVGVVPIIVGLDLTTIANSTVIVTKVCATIVIYAAMQLPKKMPELWEKSRFHVSNGLLKGICIVAMGINILSILLLLVSTSTIQIVLNLVILAVGGVLALLRYKKVEINMSYSVD